MKHLFIINPAAGKGRAVKYINIIEEIMKERQEEYYIEITERPGHAVEIVHKYVAKENYRVYAVGGDGTLNEVLNGMVGSNSSLGVIPVGSGNDFIKSIYKNKKSLKFLKRDCILGRIYSVKSVKTFIKSIIDGKIDEIDLVRINDTYYLNIASVGFDAEVVEKAARLKKNPFIPGHLSYALGVLITLLSYKPKLVTISINGKCIKTDILLAAIANGRYYGGGMEPCPEADLRDGLLDVCLVRNVNKLKILAFFPKFIKGRHGSIQEVSFQRDSTVHIASEEMLSLNIDGEVTRNKEVLFSVIPSGVQFITPDNI